jgi:hypothetical protein
MQLDGAGTEFLATSVKSRDLTLEQRLRLEKVLAKLEPDLLRWLRTVELLAEINTMQSRQLLNSIGKGEPSAWLTREANASLQRLGPKGKN